MATIRDLCLYNHVCVYLSTEPHISSYCRYTVSLPELVMSCILFTSSQAITQAFQKACINLIYILKSWDVNNRS